MLDNELVLLQFGVMDLRRKNAFLKTYTLLGTLLLKNIESFYASYSNMQYNIQTSTLSSMG